MKIELRVPPVGESILVGQIAAWLKKEGDFVRKGETLFELETEKASMPVPSPADGSLQVLFKEGTEVRIDQVVGYIDDAASATASTASPAQPGASANAASPPTQPRPSEAVSPPPSAALQPQPAPPQVQQEPAASPAPRLEGAKRSPLSMTRKTIARRLVQTRQEAAHLTTFNEVNMEELMRIRKAYGEDFLAKYKVKLGYMSFFIKASVKALQEYPVVNSRIEGDELVSPDFYDIGVAVSTERGLLVPVIRNADAMSFGELETTMGDLAARARDKRIELKELQGGTFTITNGGIFGSMLSTPIHNYPQAAILGMHAIQRRPIAVGDEVKIKPMMYLALTYDHRLIDGREAVLFLIKVKECIEDPERLILGV